MDFVGIDLSFSAAERASSYTRFNPSAACNLSHSDTMYRLSAAFPRHPQCTHSGNHKGDKTESTHHLGSVGCLTDPYEGAHRAMVPQELGNWQGRRTTTTPPSQLGTDAIIDMGKGGVGTGTAEVD